MSNQRSSLVLHITGKSPGQDQVSRIESELNTNPGVISAHTSKRHPQFMMLDFDPKAVSASEIMNCCSRQALSVQRVG